MLIGFIINKKDTSMELFDVILENLFSFLGISLAAENLTGNLYRDFIIVTFGEVVSCFTAIYLAKT